MKKEIIICGLIALLLLIPATSVSSHIVGKDIEATLTDEHFVQEGPRAESRTLDNLQFMWGVEQQTGDFQTLGCECNDTHFFVTGGNSANDPNKVYIFDFEGNYVDSFDQQGTSGWGWLDLAWDGEYFYGGKQYTSIIDVFTEDGTIVDHITGPVPWCAGIAYDPVTDHLWTIDIGTDEVLYEIDMDGNVINYYSQSYNVYGLAWDDVSEGGPFLWCAAQEPDCTFYQFDPSVGAYTGVFFDAVHPGGTTNKAAGLGFTTRWNTSVGILFAIQQCDTPNPGDQLAGYTVCNVSGEDTTPPTTTHQFTPATPNGDNGWYVSSVTVTLTATDTGSGVAWTNYSLDNGATWTTHTGSWPFDVVVGDGEYQLKYYSVDNVGNVEPTNGPFDFKVDTTKPTTTHALDPPVPDGLNGWYVSDVTITFTATDTGSGVASTKYSLNNGATWTTHTGPWPFDVIVSDCKHELLYYSVDNAGNVEPTNGPFDFDVDTTKPQIHFFSFPIVFGPYLAWVINFGFVKDGCSGLDRMEFLLNGVFHHQEDLSWWPGGMWRFVSWFYRAPGGGGDTCSAIVYDRAGNWI